MEEIKVSVIVPVYNAEEHLNQCLGHHCQSNVKGNRNYLCG